MNMHNVLNWLWCAVCPGRLDIAHVLILTHLSYGIEIETNTKGGRNYTQSIPNIETDLKQIATDNILH